MIDGSGWRGCQPGRLWARAEALGSLVRHEARTGPVGLSPVNKSYTLVLVGGR